MNIAVVIKASDIPPTNVSQLPKIDDLNEYCNSHQCLGHDQNPLEFLGYSIK